MESSKIEQTKSLIHSLKENCAAELPFSMKWEIKGVRNKSYFWQTTEIVLFISYCSMVYLYHLAFS